MKHSACALHAREPRSSAFALADRKNEKQRYAATALRSVLDCGAAEAGMAGVCAWHVEPQETITTPSGGLAYHAGDELGQAPVEHQLFDVLQQPKGITAACCVKCLEISMDKASMSVSDFPRASSRVKPTSLKSLSILCRSRILIYG